MMIWTLYWLIPLSRWVSVKHLRYGTHQPENKSNFSPSLSHSLKFPLKGSKNLVVSEWCGCHMPSIKPLLSLKTQVFWHFFVKLTFHLLLHNSIASSLSFHNPYLPTTNFSFRQCRSALNSSYYFIPGDTWSCVLHWI